MRDLHISLTADALLALVDKSLLHRASTGRYEIHELLRQYTEDSAGLVIAEANRSLYEQGRAHGTGAFLPLLYGLPAVVPPSTMPVSARASTRVDVA
jgi:hypothetical protein